VNRPIFVKKLIDLRQTKTKMINSSFYTYRRRMHFISGSEFLPRDAL